MDTDRWMEDEYAQGAGPGWYELQPDTVTHRSLICSIGHGSGNGPAGESCRTH
jgi:hypothetical protein